MNRRLLVGGLLMLSLSGCAFFPKAKPTHSAVTPVARADNKGWMDRHESFNARAKKGEVDVIFIGDSITQGWEGEGKASWEKHFAPKKAMNLGIGGDRTQHVLWRLENGNLEGLDPKVAVIMIGTNNYKDNSAEEIADGIVAIVETLRAERPKMGILLLAIFPRDEKPSENRAKLAEASRRASGSVADGKRVRYLDIGMVFLKPDGTIPADIMPDFLHLTPAGYELWANAIDGELAAMLAGR